MQIAQQLDTVCKTVETIDATVTEIRDQQIANNVHISAIVGPPSLEDKLRAYVDAKTEHKSNNSAQQLVQVQTILQLEQQNSELRLQSQIKTVDERSKITEKDREKNHVENTARFQKIERILYMLVGGLVVVEVLLKILFK